MLGSELMLLMCCSQSCRLSFPQQTIDAIKRLTGEKINFVQLVWHCAE